MTGAPVEESAQRRCPACGEAVEPEARFCEACGADLGVPEAGPGSVAERAAGQSAPAPAGGPGDGPGAGSGGPAGATGGSPARHVPSLVADSGDEGYPPACPSCGGTIADDGYCERCGQRAPLWRDHFEEAPVAGLALVCDRGIRHRRNEDAGLVAAHPAGGMVLVVCDGVSSSQDSDVGSLAAVRAAAAVLERVPSADPGGVVLEPEVPATGGSEDGTGPEAPTGPMAVTDPPTLPDLPTVPGSAQGSAGDPERPPTRAALIAEALAEAVEAANQAVIDSGRAETAGNPPSCTFVAGLLEPTPVGHLLVVGSIGDSRAYWLPDPATGRPPERLTTDDSWAAEEIALGVPREEAETGPHAHAITRWLGPDAPDLRPRVVARLLEHPGWVMLCSDGLWNYCSEPTDLGRVFTTVAGRPEAVPDADPTELARGLVVWANSRGGHDNITVALARVPG